MTISGQDANCPSWMEIVEKDGKPQLRIQARTGAVRPFMDAPIQGSKMTVVVSRARGTSAEITWELTADRDKLVGTQKMGNAESKVTGVRAPALKRPMPKPGRSPSRCATGRT